MSTELPSYRNPIISIDRRAQKIACFDGFDIVRPFKPYDSEAAALIGAHEWFKLRTIHVPQVVYPVITEMRVS